MSHREERTQGQRWQTKITIRRITVRDLVLLITLICIYLGLWEATKREVPHSRDSRWKDSSPFPFVIREDYRVGANRNRTAVVVRSQLYLWSFGNEKREPYRQPMCEWRWEADYETSLKMFPARVPSMTKTSQN